MTKRTPRQVAERTLILGALTFRASLEVTDDPRAADLSGRLLPWLHKLGCGDELDSIEREELSTPLGRLGESQRVDVNWAGEAASLFCWMLNLGELLSETHAADQTEPLRALHILKPEAAALLQSASLRDGEEIRRVCRHFALVVSEMRAKRVKPPASDVVRRLAHKELAATGCPVPEDAIRLASESVDRMSDQERKAMAGPSWVRAHAAIWFLSDRRTFYIHRGNT